MADGAPPISSSLNVSASLADARALIDWLEGHETREQPIARMTGLLAECLRGGGRILSCGNGGSMCDAMHFAEELSGRNREDRAALSAQAMSDPGHLTCVANDYGFERVFARGVEAWARGGDALVIFSTSGRSRNVILAAEAAKKRQVAVLGLLGRDGGEVKALCDVSLVVPGETSDRIQEVHIKVAHLIIEGIERQLFSRQRAVGGRR